MLEMRRRRRGRRRMIDEEMSVVLSLNGRRRLRVLMLMWWRWRWGSWVSGQVRMLVSRRRRRRSGQIWLREGERWELLLLLLTSCRPVIKVERGVGGDVEGDGGLAGWRDGGRRDQRC